MTFSVIVPVYNVAPFLRECLDSLGVAAAKAGAAVDVEVVCVDDGSTDESGAVLDGYEAKDFLLRVIHKENGGVSSARNAGMDCATGEWMLFVDSDDSVRDTYFAGIAALVSSTPDADLVGFGMLPFYGGNVDWADDGGSPRTLDLGNEIADELASMSVYRFAYKSSIAGKLRFKPYAYGEDLVFTAEAFARARLGVVSSRKEYLYRFREGSATHADITAEKMKTVVSAMADTFSVLADSGKSLGAAFRIGRGHVWLREQPRAILARIRKPGWHETWELWLDTMESAAKMPFFSFWQRLAAQTAASSRSKLVVRLMCCLPGRLWRLGLSE